MSGPKQIYDDNDSDGIDRGTIDDFQSVSRPDAPRVLFSKRRRNSDR